MKTSLGAVHKVRPQNFWDLGPPCLQFGMISVSKSKQPPVLCPLLGTPLPPCVDVLYGWPLSSQSNGHFSYKGYPLTLYDTEYSQSISDIPIPLYFLAKIMESCTSKSDA